MGSQSLKSNFQIVVVSAEKNLSSQIVVHIVHKETKFVVLKSKVLEDVPGSPIVEQFMRDFLREYYTEQALFVIVGLCRLRKKAIDLNVDTIEQVFVELEDTADD